MEFFQKQSKLFATTLIQLKLNLHSVSSVNQIRQHPLYDILAMKKTPLLLLLFFSYIVASQNFNGSYKSYLTSFKSEIDSAKNFKEKAEFNLSVTDTYITIQDIRLPQKPLIYKCKKPLKKLFNLYIKEKCTNEHLEDDSVSEITFYKKENRLNLMVSDNTSSQVFFNLKLVSKHEN